MLKIGLLGFDVCDANKGCEALTYSFLHILKSMLNEPVEIRFFIPTAPLNHLQERFPEFSFSIGKLKIKDPKLKFISDIRSCDLVCDITCGDGFSDIYFPKNVFYTTLFKIIVERCGRPLFLLPQTYGPFKDKRLEKLAKSAINGSKVIYSRDAQSADYVMKLCGKRIMNVTDLAFALPYDPITLDRTKTHIGINVSGLLWNGGFTCQNQFGLACNYREFITSLIRKYCDDIRYQVHLIPHVIETEKDSIDGDVKICNELAIQYNAIAAPAFSTPIEAKNYISAMDVFIGARMHSTIAAYSSGVPVIPFSYSRKFEGLYENLDYPYLVHGREDDTETAIQKATDWIANADKLKCKIDESMKKIDMYIESFSSDFFEKLSRFRR